MKNQIFIRQQPVAKFFYKGAHSHPVRRTILIVEQSDALITGYELREGSITRSFNKAPIKSYRKDKIAKIYQIDKRRKLRKESKKTFASTMKRYTLADLIRIGI